MATKGFAAPEVGAAYSRVLELWRQLGETLRLFPALLGLRTFYTVWAELQTARELAEPLVALTEKSQDPAVLVQARRAIGITLFQFGAPVLARAYLEQAMALYNPSQHHSHSFIDGFEPRVQGMTTKE